MNDETDGHLDHTHSLTHTAHLFPPPTHTHLLPPPPSHRYRFNKKPFETTVGGLPRLLDIGQCNDAYGAIKIASALAEHYKCGVNDLPLNYAISWVCIYIL
jgi:hypothetical protein